MKRFWCILLLGLLLHCSADSATLQDLINDLRSLAAEKDTALSLFSDADASKWINMAQDKIVRLGGYIPKDVDVVVSLDSLSLALPADFRSIHQNGAVLRKVGIWSRCLNNPGFMVDTNVVNYFVGWAMEDSARFYVKGGILMTNDTIRVFYYAFATDMLATDSVCHVPSDMQTDIVEEAMGYVEQARKRYDAQQIIKGQVRSDMEKR